MIQKSHSRKILNAKVLILLTIGLIVAFAALTVIGQSNILDITDDNNNPLLYIEDTGNVGVGTTSPGQRLTVVGTVESTSGGFKFPDGTVQTTSATSDNLGNHTATQNIVLGGNWLSGDGGDEGVSVDSNGNVGVGTTTPSSQLHVVGEGRFEFGSGYVQVTTPGVHPGFVIFRGTDPGTDRFDMANVGSYFGFGFNADWLAVGTTPSIAIKAGGNVGIGTNNPGQKLTVVGTVESTSGGFKFPDGTVQTTSASSDNLGNHTATQNIVLGSNWLSGDGGDEGVLVDSSGNVGVGTTSPDTALHIVGGSDPTLKIQSDGTGEISGKVALRQSNESGADIYYDGVSSVEGLRFDVLASGTPAPTSLFISNKSGSIGNVGIGTTTPTSQLHLVGDGRLRLEEETAPVSGSQWDINHDAQDRLAIEHRISGGSLSVPFVIETSGDVGIGTTSPGQKLTVVGTVESTSGGFKFPDGTV